MLRFSGIQGIFQSSSRSNSHCTLCLNYPRVFLNILEKTLGAVALPRHLLRVGKVEPELSLKAPLVPCPAMGRNSFPHQGSSLLALNTARDEIPLLPVTIDH